MRVPLALTLVRNTPEQKASLQAAILQIQLRLYDMPKRALVYEKLQAGNHIQLALLFEYLDPHSVSLSLEHKIHRSIADA